MEYIRDLIESGQNEYEIRVENKFYVSLARNRYMDSNRCRVEFYKDSLWVLQIGAAFEYLEDEIFMKFKEEYEERILNIASNYKWNEIKLLCIVGVKKVIDEIAKAYGL